MGLPHHSIFGPRSKGPEVRLVQRRLDHLGYASVKATGYFGLVIQRAVKEFQRTHHLRGDGVVGPRTERALRAVRERGTVSSASPALEAAPPRTYRVVGDCSAVSCELDDAGADKSLAPAHRLQAGQVTRTLPPHQTPLRYRVKRGDTMASIARRFHTAWTKLAAVNHLGHPAQLRAGSLITIRAASPRWVHAVWTLSRRVIATALHCRGLPYVGRRESARIRLLGSGPIRAVRKRDSHCPHHLGAISCRPPCAPVPTGAGRLGRLSDLCFWCIACWHLHRCRCSAGTAASLHRVSRSTIRFG